MQNMKKMLCALSFLFVLSSLVSGGTNTEDGLVVRGSVYDAGGNPVVGAVVVVKDSDQASITDSDGKFGLEVENEDCMLEVSCLGYVTKVFKASAEIQKIILEEDRMVLDDVVVVGYGTQRKASITGSVANVTNKDLISTRSISVANTLVGKLPGLRAVQRSGAPGEDMPEIDIRGFGNALVIVDGVERSFAKLNPNDIESISILKDASAAVYGSKGANGVILVTTKRGSDEKAVFEYSGWFGIQQMTRYPRSYSSLEYAILTNEAANNIGLPNVYSDEQIRRFRTGEGEFYKSTDWLEAVTRKTAPVWAHDFSVSGGSENVKYRLSFGVMDQQSYFRSNDWNDRRYNMHANITANLTKNLSVGLNIIGQFDRRNVSGAQGVFYNIQTAKPFGSPRYFGEPVGPLRSTYREWGYSLNDQRTLNTSFDVSWKLPWVKGLSINGKFSFDYFNYRNKNWSPKSPYTYEPVESGEVVKSYIGSTVGRLSDQMGTNMTKDIQLNVSYARKFGRHDINAIVLYQATNPSSEWLSAQREFAINLLPLMSSGNDLNKTNGGSETSSLMQAYVGRVNYAYADRYLLELVARYDGSSLFSPKSRWGFFPSASLGWRISEEAFVKDNVSWISNIKLRASYGIVGDQSGFGAFQYMSGYIYPGGKYLFDSEDPTIGLFSSGLANEDLTWYESKMANVGLDLGFFDGRLVFEADMFKRKRDGLMAYRTLTLPTSFGTSLPQENLNSDITHGFEFLLGHSNTIGDFSYNLRANVSLTRSKYDYVERAADANGYLQWKNDTNSRNKNIVWGYNMIGQFQNFEEILNSPIQDNAGNKTLLPGDFRYEDINNDGIIDDRDVKPISVGNTPFAYYSLNIGLNWRDFDCSIFFQGAGGHKLQLGMAFYQPFMNEGNSSGLSMWYEQRSHQNENGEWVIGKLPPVRKAGFANNEKVNSYYMLDADYLRLKNVEIGYTIPKKLTDRIKVDKIRVYVNGNNLLTFTSGWMMDYIDPENGESNAWYYPQAKTFNAGVNIVF